MKRKCLTGLLIASLCMTMAGCGGAEDAQKNSAETAVQEEVDPAEAGIDEAEAEPDADTQAAKGDTTEVESEAVSLPAYTYPGSELFYTVLYQYIMDEFSPHYEAADVGIPCPEIVAMDDSDPEDIRVWGDFWYFNYRLNGEVLENTSGGSYPGLIHVKSTDDGYEVTGMEIVEDGSDFTESAKKIFGEHYDKFQKLTEDTDEREKTRAQIIANYVAANALSIKSYQDSGWDPVTLPEENIDNFYGELD